MYSHNGTLYPMLGVGAFMSMFWVGVVVGYELGLGCAVLLIAGLLSGCIATVGVCELQRRDAHGLSAGARGGAPRRAQPGAQPGARPAQASRQAGVPAAVIIPGSPVETATRS